MTYRTVNYDFKTPRQLTVKVTHNDGRVFEEAFPVGMSKGELMMNVLRNIEQGQYLKWPQLGKWQGMINVRA